ncbi:hypothetical protein D3C84_1148890 [compost metagenome]
MTPDAGEGVVVAVQITAVVGVIPEIQRHAWHGGGADQFADFIDHGLACIIEGIYRCAQHPALHLAEIHGQRRVTADEGACKVCTSRHGG